MPFEFTPSQNLQIFRYSDIDCFCQGLRDASVDIVPLNKTSAPLGQAILSLPGCDLYLLRTFPRIIHTMLRTSGAFVIFAMDDGFSVVLNGRRVESACLMFARGPIEYRAVERQPGFYAAIVFSSSMEERGWPRTRGEFITVCISRGIRRMLRGLILDLFEAASRSSGLMAPQARAGLEESLLCSLDSAFEGAAARGSSKIKGSRDNLRTLKAIDNLIDSKLSTAIYS